MGTVYVFPSFTGGQNRPTGKSITTSIFHRSERGFTKQSEGVWSYNHLQHDMETNDSQRTQRSFHWIERHYESILWEFWISSWGQMSVGCLSYRISLSLTVQYNLILCMTYLILFVTPRPFVVNPVPCDFVECFAMCRKTATNTEE